MKEQRKINILDYKAVGDGKTLNTEAIQQAVDACPAGGCVYVPAGTFVTGAIYLKSDMTLYLEEGSVLLGSGDLGQYPVLDYWFEGRAAECYASLINVGNRGEGEIRNLTLEGKGKIDANGVELFHKEMEEKRGIRGRALFLSRVTNLTIRGITVKQSPSWCVHLLYCRDVKVDDVRIFTRYDEDGRRYEGIFNGDGLDLDSCQNVEVTNCMIASQDDCIAIKSGRDEEGRKVGIPSENIHIANCTFRTGFGVAVGSEMSGGVRRVSVENCRFYDTFSVVSIKAPRGRGNVIEDIHIADCFHRNESREHKACKWFRGAIYIDQFYGCDEFDPEKKEEINEGTPKIRDIYMKNIDTETAEGHAVYIMGLPEMPVEHVVLENVQAKGPQGLFQKNVEGLKRIQVTVEPEEE